MDSLVISGRIRYPSSQQPMDDSPKLVDRHITRTLLSFDDQPHARHVSANSSVPSAASSQRDTTTFVERYNELAKKFGLCELNALAEANTEKADKDTNPTASKPTTRRSLWRKLVRSSSPLEPPEPARLARKTSIGRLLGKQEKLWLNCQSLDDYFQYGGTSILNLPAPYRALRAGVPTCLAATGNYLIEHGENTAGLFRIPGQASVVNALYKHYNDSIREAAQAGEKIHASIGSTQLPAHMSCSTHDVASAFKKFLWDLPGGILGSVDLFAALQDIQQNQTPEKMRKQLCALAILSLMSSRRIAVVCAVFGLLALIKRDPDEAGGSPVTPTRLVKPESMSSRAMSLVFAPILLGGMSEQVELRKPSQTGSSPGQQAGVAEPTRRGFKAAFRTPRHRKSNSDERTPEMSAGIERNNAAARIIEMLIRNWEEVATQIRFLEPAMGRRRHSRSSNSLYDSAARLRRSSAVHGKSQHMPMDGSSGGFLQVPQIARAVSLGDMSPERYLQELVVYGRANTDGSLLGAGVGYPGRLSAADEEIFLAHNQTQKFDAYASSLAKETCRAAKDEELEAACDASRDASESTTLFTPAKNDRVGKMLAQDLDEWESYELSEQDDTCHLIVDETNTTARLVPKNRVQPHAFSSDRGIYSAASTKAECARLELKTALLYPVDSVLEISKPGKCVESTRLDHSPHLLHLDTAATPSGNDCKAPVTVTKAPRSPFFARFQQGTPSCHSGLGLSHRKPIAAEPSPKMKVVEAKPSSGNLQNSSQCMIPRPVIGAGKGRSPKSASPRPRRAWRGPRRPKSLLLTSHTNVDSMQHKETDPKVGQRETPACSERMVARVPIMRTEPVPQSREHFETCSAGLRGQPVARRLHFGSYSSSSTSANESNGWKGSQPPTAWGISQPPQRSTNVGTLYAEIRMLHRKLEQTQREAAGWRHRAECAESALFRDKRHRHQHQDCQY